jgi:riboflavin biosynthesis pyrimidine reductase
LQQVSDAFGVFPTKFEDYFRQLVSGLNVTASLVADGQGNTVSSMGNSSGLGNSTDLALLIALRRQSQVILTTGKTFRSDQYKFPKQADLAVLTNQEIDIAVPDGQRLILSHSNYLQALTDLKSAGYSRVHVEYGLTGIRSLVQASALDALLLSSQTRSGVNALAQDLNVEPIIFPLEDLYVGLVAWQPSGSQLRR